MESNIVSAVFLPASLFLIMFGLGLTLLTDDFKRLLENPRATLLGVSLQILALPLVAFLLANTLLRDSPVMAVGLMILAVCPGGATSNLITYLARGDKIGRASCRERVESAAEAVRVEAKGL